MVLCLSEIRTPHVIEKLQELELKKADLSHGLESLEIELCETRRPQPS